MSLGDGRDGGTFPGLLGSSDPRGFLGPDINAVAAAEHGAAAPLTRLETYILLEAARAPKGVVDLEKLDGSEEAKFTAAKRLEVDGFLKLLGPSSYQVTRAGRDPKLLADAAIAWIRRKA